MFSGVFLIPGMIYPETLSFVQSLLYFLSPSLHFVSIYFIRYYLYFLYIICISFTKIQYGRKYIEPWCFTFTQKNPRQYYYQGCTAGDLLILFVYFFLTITLSRCQISSTYSWMVLSEVNLPLQAVLRRAFFAQPFSSLYASSTFFCAAA